MKSKTYLIEPGFNGDAQTPGDISRPDFRLSRGVMPGDFVDRHRRVVDMTSVKHQADLMLECLASVFRGGIDDIRSVRSDRLADEIPLQITRIFVAARTRPRHKV